MHSKSTRIEIRETPVRNQPVTGPIRKQSTSEKTTELIIEHFSRDPSEV